MAEDKRTVREVLEGAQAGDASAMRMVDELAKHDKQRKAITEEFMAKIGTSFEEMERQRREQQAELDRQAQVVAQERAAIEADRIRREQATLEAIHSIKELAEGFSAAAAERERQSSEREDRMVTMTDNLVKLTRVLTVLTIIAVILTFVSLL